MSVEPHEIPGYEYHGDEIAIVGLALRVPGANDPWTFWGNLAQGLESIETLSDEALTEAGADTSLFDNPRFVKAKAALNNIGEFDARFFGLSPFDASLMDPQYRHFLELVWEAFESAGEDPREAKGTIGVYAGSGQNTYLMHHLMSHRKLRKSPGDWYLRHVGNDKDFMSTLASYHFDLKGPSINVQTACSTSLVATHLATQALISRECDMAIAGGITIDFPQGKGYLAPENGIEDPRGECRSFDASSQGTVFGSGGGAVLLKRYEDAKADGNHIFAVIKASAVSNDGGQKAGFTAPSVDGQTAVIVEALELGDINPETIGYVEGHGTATPIGDPIEVEALTMAWRSKTKRRQFAALSSVKSNLGHLDTGAGVVSLIKAIGAVDQGVKYPTVHFKNPNPALQIEQSPFYVSGEAEIWNSEVPRRAAVSSLGVGGTNAHVIIEQFKRAEVRQTANLAADQAVNQLKSQPFYVPFSAKTPSSLKKYLQNFAGFLDQHQEHLTLDSIVKSLQSRRSFEFRAVIAAQSFEGLKSALANPDRIIQGSHPALEQLPKKVAFAFTGQGTQYFNIGRDLYLQNADYRKTFDQCAELLIPHFGQDIRQILFNENPSQQEQDYLDRIDVTHPVLFSVAYALAQAWMAKGITPDAMIGHSLGEYVAATLAGVFQLDQVLALVCTRGRLMQSTPEGVMLSVAADEADLIPILQQPPFSSKLSIAGVNVKGMSVVAGEPETGQKLIEHLDQLGMSVKPLRIPRASHSVLMDSILDEYQQAVAQCQMQPAGIPIVSNLNGQWLKPDQSADPAYWREHLRQAVRFADGAETLMQDLSGYLFIEIGPGNQLTRLLEAHPARANRHAVISSIPGPKEAINSFDWFEAGLARAWTLGAAELKNTLADTVPKIPLPTYAWDHQTLFIEPQKQEYNQDGEIEKLPIQHWYSLPSWNLMPHRKAAEGIVETKPLALCFTDYVSDRFSTFVSGLAARFEVICVYRSDVNEILRDTHHLAFKVNGTEEAGYQWLFEQLFTLKKELLAELKLSVEWVDQQSAPETQAFYLRQRQYFHQCFFAVKTMSQFEWKGLSILAAGQEFLPFYNAAPINPMKSMVQGPIRSFAAEQEQVQSLCIDLDDTALHSKSFYQSLWQDLASKNPWDEIVYRGAQRYVRDYQIMNFQSVESATLNENLASQMRTGGCYLIAGLGDLALVVAHYIVDQCQGIPILVGRRQLPEQSRWASIASSSRIDAEAQRIRSLNRLLQKAPEMVVVAADIADASGMLQQMKALKQKLGAIHGVFHTAGLLQDQLLQLKTIAQAEAVLAPKVQGLEFYNQWHKQNPLDFIMLFSSTSAFTGTAGQSDYASANGFLAAWARQQRAEGLPVTAVLWGIWADVGMAAQAGIAQGIHSQVLDFKLGFLQVCHQIKGPHGIQHQCYGLVSDAYWIFDNHRTKQGMALCPGTGYIDLFAKSIIHLTGMTSVSLTQLSFNVPLGIAAKESVLIGLLVDQPEELKAKNAYRLQLVSGTSIEQLQQQQFEQLHATAIASAVDDQKKTTELSLIQSRCSCHQIYASNAHEHILFGPEWQVLPEAWYGDREALLRLKLPNTDSEKLLQEAPWHPGMLDLAIGAQSLMDFDPQEFFYVPLFYEQITMFAPLEKETFSHVRLKSDGQQTKPQAPELAVFDIDIYSAAGVLLVQVKGFHLKRSDIQVFDLEPVPAVKSDIALFEARTLVALEEDDIFAQTFQKGIKPAEGQHVIHSLLQLEPMPAEVVVSSVPLTSYLQKQKRQVVEQQQLQPRPHLSVAYAAPQGQLELLIADLWGQALGLESIGRDDQFFELGGHSLLLIQIIARLKRKIDMPLPMARLFETSTLAQWSEVIGHIEEKQDEVKQTIVHNSQDQSHLVKAQSLVTPVSRQDFAGR